ncbi:hypothetical protein [Streptomyces sp. TRM68416]|uniref:hypothetical protein n=1 Tax=Streptomyces sp. TRM68416 TaxID=2758412 RepID=UPI001661F0AE|nr:hypothetical protein [Streptomyces sp. TRM68416]MBD0841072.1 hypothetical protein [Streptomyces sp. TRM68416]
MKSLTTSAHIEPDTRFRVTAFPDRANSFVSLRIEGESVAVTLMAALGTAETLRNLATAAFDAADALDALTSDVQEAK